MDAADLHGQPVTLVQMIQAHYCELLPGITVGPETDFFDNGGSSFSAARLVAALRRSGHHLALDDVFAARTPSRLAIAASSISVSARGYDSDPTARRSDAESAREILDGIEGEVLHACQTSNTDFAVRLTSPLQHDRTSIAALSRQLVELFGMEVPYDVLRLSPAAIADHLRSHGAQVVLPARLASGVAPSDDASATTTVLLAPSPTNILDFRRAIGDRRTRGAVIGIVPSRPMDYQQTHDAWQTAHNVATSIAQQAEGRPVRFVGYCTSAWLADRVAAVLELDFSTVSEIVGINPPDVHAFSRHRFAHFILGVWGIDATTAPPQLTRRINDAQDRWLSGRCSLTEACSTATNEMMSSAWHQAFGRPLKTSFLDRQAPTFLQNTVIEMTYQFAVGQSVVDNPKLESHARKRAVVTRDAAPAQAVGTPFAARQATTSFDCPLRLLLRLPEAAQIVLGAFSMPDQRSDWPAS